MKENNNKDNTMKLETSSGNFSVEINGEVEEKLEIIQRVYDAGIRYIVEREGFGQCYKELAGTGAKQSLPKGFKRDSVPFNEDNAAVFELALEKVLAKLGDFDLRITQYVAPDSDSGMKKATELFNTAKAKGVLEGLAGHETIQYKGDLADSAAFIAHIHTKKYAKVKPEAELEALGLD